MWNRLKNSRVVWIAGFLLLAVAPSLGATRTVHVFVALADNVHQGIVPVPSHLGNGDNAAENLYWGSGYGVKSFFARSGDWKLASRQVNPRPAVLERCIYRYRSGDVYLIADAYRGREIKQAIMDFLSAAAAATSEKIVLPASNTTLWAGGRADLVAYIGHDGLMDFSLSSLPDNHNVAKRPVIILSCASKYYFADAVRATGADPLLWTTNLMCPEAYTLKSALDGWIAGESAQQIRERAAAAYNQYQKCGIHAARKLLVSGW
jgi:hypothetical protein